MTSAPQSVTLLELAERVEKESWPSREMDARIFAAIKGVEFFEYKHIGLGMDRFSHGPGCEWEAVPRYTESIDAAMMLVPEKLPDCSEILIDLEGDRSHAFVSIQTRGDYEGVETILGSGEGSTIAQALCAASLRALHSINENK